MTVIEPRLGIPPEVQQGLDAGRYYRDGGVVREVESGRIVALLRDVDIGRDAVGDILGGLLPQALNISTALRVARLEAEVQRLIQTVQAVHVQGRAMDAKLDGVLLGGALALIHRVRLHEEVGDQARASALAEELYGTSVQLFTAAGALVAQPEAMATYIQGWQAYVRGALAAGALALELYIRTGDERRAIVVARELARSAQELERQVTALFTRPSSLFWMTPAHRTALVELREAVRRTNVRRDVLDQGLFRHLHVLAKGDARELFQRSREASGMST